MEQGEKEKIESLLLQIPKAERSLLRERIFRKPKKKSARVDFPKIAIKYQGATGMCITKKDALRHLGSILIADVEKRSSSTIKAHVVEALSTLAELEDSQTAKRDTLMRAVKIILETDRLKLFYRVTSLATLV